MNNKLTDGQNKIIITAMTMIPECGINNITLKKIAERMGVTEPAIYRHFKNKNDFIEKLYLTMRIVFISNFETIINKPTDAKTKLKEMIVFALELNRKKKGIAFILMTHAILNNEPRLLELMNNIKNTYLSYIEKVLLECQQKKYIDKKTDIKTAAKILLGITQTEVINFLLSGCKERPGKNIDQILNYYFNGVK